MKVTRADLTWCLLLFAAGAIAIFAANNVPRWVYVNIPMGLIQFFVATIAFSGFASLGAATGSLFRRKALGAAAGALLYVGIVLAVHL